jgi:hypothetical protein
MSCRLDIEEQSFNKALSLATKGVNHVQEGNKIFYPINLDGKVNNITGAYKLAKRRVNEINIKFNSAKYGRSATIDNGYTKGVAIIIDVQNSYINDTVIKNEKANEMKEAMEIQRQDAKRKDIDYDDRYQFDDMLTSSDISNIPDGYNFGEFLERKRKILSYIVHRKNVLSKMKDKNVADRRQAFYLKEQASKETKNIDKIGRLLKSDVSVLSEGQTILGNLMKFFHNDLKEVRKIMETPTIENLVVAQQYLENIQNGINTSLVEDGTLLEKELKDMPVEFQAMFNKLRTEFNNTSDDFKKVSERASAKMLDDAREKAEDEADADEKQQLDNLKEILAQEDSNIFEYWLLPVDGDGRNAPPVQMLVRKIIDDAFAVKETSAIQSELLDIKKSLEKVLPTIPSFKANMLGKFFTKSDYSIFKRVTNSGNSRLVSKFSLSWEAVKTKTTNSLRDIKEDTFKPNKDESDRIAIDNRRKKLFNALKKEQVNFLDISKLVDFTTPGIVDSITRIENILNLGKNNLLNSFDEDDAYKEALIQSLIREGGTRKSAEAEYNKIIVEQREKFHEFELELESKLNYHLETSGVSSISELSESAINDIQNYYYLNSPITFSQAYKNTKDSKVPQIVNRAQEDHHHSLEYVSFLPTKDSDFDSNFVSQIESNDTIFRAWELFSEGLKFINENRKYSFGGNEFIDSLIDVSKEHKLEMAANSKLTMTKLSSITSAFDVVVKAIGLNATTDGGRAELSGTVQSIDEAVKRITKPISARLRARGIAPTQILKAGEQIPDGIKKIINKNVKLRPITRDTTVKQYIDDAIREDIFRSQDNDMVDSITSQMAVVQVFKAKKEVETKINFFLNLVRSAVNQKDISKKSNIVKLIEAFVNTHLYGMRERGQGPVGSLILFKTFSRESLIRKSMLEEAIIEITAIANNTPEGASKTKMLKDIDGLKGNLKNLGTRVTPGSLGEAILLKAKITAGLGYNVSSQIMNLAIGNMAGRQNDGLAWKRGNFSKAYSYERQRKKVKYLNNKNINDGHDLTDALINSLGVFQNSANDFVTITTGQKFKDKISPLYIIGETEKIIQRPQILSMLGDMDNFISIKDSNGKKFPVFDVNNHSNPHPAFELINGVLKLKTDKDANGNSIPNTGFDTEDNRATWLTRSSQEYANTFGNSGKIPRTIALINGDYRETSSVMAKKNVFGALLMTFKTWVAAYYLRRHGEEKGVYSNLSKEGHYSEAFTGLSLKAGLYATLVGGSMVFSPIAGLIAGAALMGRSKVLKSMEDDMSMAQVMFATVQNISFNKNFALGALNTGYQVVGIPAAATLKLIQKLTTMFVSGGKQVIPNSLIDKVLNMRETEGEDFEKNKARMHFLLTEIANIMQMMVFKSMALMLLAPDDDEDEKYKDLTLAQKLANHKDTMLYYMIENMTNRFASDIGLDVDVLGIMGLASVQTADDIETVLATMARSLRGNSTYQSGPNKDRNRSVVQFEKQFVPRGARELMQGKAPTLGLGSYVGKDKSPGDMLGKWLGSDSAAEHYTEIWRDTRKTMKEEMLVEWIKENPNVEVKEIEKAVWKEVDKIYPSIKGLFAPSGKMYDGAESELLRYDKIKAEE